MRTKTTTLALLLCGLLALPLSSAAVIIDFDDQFFTVPFSGPVIEDGFTYTALSPGLALLDVGGNPDVYLTAGAPGTLESPASVGAPAVTIFLSVSNWRAKTRRHIPISNTSIWLP